MYYFAYGLNLNSERNSNWQHVTTGKILDFKWIINERGVATIVPSKLSSTWGSVFRIEQHHLNELDSFEGYPKHYHRIEQTVHSKEVEFLCWVYIDKNTTNGSARANYLERVIAGGIDQNLPHSWIEELSRWRI